MQTLDTVFPPVCHPEKQFPLPFAEAPRPCITGAQFSVPTSKIDWIEFTVYDMPVNSVLSDVLKIPFDVFTDTVRTIQGFSNILEYQTIKVLYSPRRPDFGCKVILSGSALDVLSFDVIELLPFILLQCSLARLDVAVDDRRPDGLDLDTVLHAVRSAHDVTHFRGYRVIEEVSRSSREIIGRGVYFGSTASSRMLRLYDKRLERMAAGDEDPGSWLRAELQCRKRAAVAVAQVLVEDPESIPGIIRGVLDFRDDSSENSTRCETLSFWSDFLSDCERIKTGVKKVVTTIHQKAAWLGIQCKNAMAQVLAAFGPRSFAQLVRAGFADTTDDVWARLIPGYTPRFDGLFDIDKLAFFLYDEQKLCKYHDLGEPVPF